MHHKSTILTGHRRSVIDQVEEAFGQILISSIIEQERFKNLKTFIVSQSENNLQSLYRYTQSHLTVDCGNYTYVNLASKQNVFLNQDSFPSMNVDLSLEELSYSEGGVYRVASYSTENYQTNLRSMN